MTPKQGVEQAAQPADPNQVPPMTEPGKWLFDILTTATLDGTYRVKALDLMALGAELYPLQRIEQAAEQDARQMAGLLMQVGAVLSHWRDDNGLLHCDRSNLRRQVDLLGYDGHMLAEELNELAERV